jgi:hypothetical protein
MFDEFVSALPTEFGAEAIERAVARLSEFEATVGHSDPTISDANRRLIS